MSRLAAFAPRTGRPFLPPWALVLQGPRAAPRWNTGEEKFAVWATVLVEDPCFCCRAQLLEPFLAARFRVHPHHRLRSRKAVANPRPVGEHQFEPVGPNHARNFAAAELRGIAA